MSEYPNISIITPTLNSEKYIRCALESLKLQGYPKLESIIVDGGSDDNTVDIAKKYDFTSVQVIPGAGLYTALNEGIKASTGQIIGFMNSDDLLTQGTLQLLSSLFGSDNTLDVVCGRAMSFRNNSTGKEIIVDNYDKYNGKTLELDTLLFGVPLMNAHFFRAELFKILGCFDDTYRLAADREFLLRVYRSGSNYFYSDSVMYKYRVHDDSLTLNKMMSNAAQIGLEHIEMANRMCNEKANGHDDEKQKEFLYTSSVTAIIGLVRQYKFRQAFRIFIDRSKEDYLWPLYMIRIILFKTKRRITG